MSDISYFFRKSATIAILIAFIIVISYAISLIIYSNQLQELSNKDPDGNVCNLLREEIQKLRTIAFVLLGISAFVIYTILAKKFPILLEWFSNVWLLNSMFIIILIITVMSLYTLNKVDNQDCKLEANTVKITSIITITVSSVALAIMIGYTIYKMRSTITYKSEINSQQSEKSEKSDTSPPLMKKVSESSKQSIMSNKRHIESPNQMLM